MKKLAVVSLLIAMFGLSVLITLICGLCNVSAQDGVWIQPIFAGHPSCLFGPFLWSRYPQIELQRLVSFCFFDWTALLTTLLPFGIAAWVLSRRSAGRKLLFPLSLAVGGIPFLAATCVLRISHLPETEVGPWLATMLLGPVYGCAVCVLLAVWELSRRRPAEPHAFPLVDMAT